MKKLFSISIALLMLLSGLQLTISRHYCGGELADSKVSVLGQIASCGMEGETDECTQPGNHLESSCCNNKISVYGVDQNYAPSFTQSPSFAQTLLHIFIVPESSVIHSFTAINLVCADNSPPENILVNSVSLPKICVFLI